MSKFERRRYVPHVSSAAHAQTADRNSGGSLDIGIGGTTSTKFDALNATSAVLGGGLTINSSEEYTLIYQATDVLLTVVSTASPASSLGAAVQEFNARAASLAEAGRSDRMAPKPRPERIRATDRIRKGAKQ
jgi:hypothetical protein